MFAVTDTLVMMSEGTLFRREPRPKTAPGNRLIQAAQQLPEVIVLLTFPIDQR